MRILPSNKSIPLFAITSILKNKKVSINGHVQVVLDYRKKETRILGIYADALGAANKVTREIAKDPKKGNRKNFAILEFNIKGL